MQWFIAILFRARDWVCVNDVAAAELEQARMISGSEAVTRLESENPIWVFAPEKVVESVVGNLVRNAVDHGLETPAERVECGKPEVGHILLAAAHEGGNVVIEVTDLFTSDVPLLGLQKSRREQFGVRRVDADRTFLLWAKSFPINLEREPFRLMQDRMLRTYNNTNY